MSISVVVAQQGRKVPNSSSRMTTNAKLGERVESGFVKSEHLIAATTLEIAENNASLEHNTELNSLQPFGELFAEWVTFCADADFDSDIWSFKISKGTQIGPDLTLAKTDIFGYAIVRNKKIAGTFICSFSLVD